MIVFIYLKKQLGIDISESFSVSNKKVHHMLQDVNLNQFVFNQGFLECGNKKIDLTSFLTVAAEEIAKKSAVFETNNMHNLTNVLRSRSEMGVFSDYPHFYEMCKEGQSTGELFGQRETENGNFVISCQKDVFCLYGQNFMGQLCANMLGTQFDLYDFGLEPKNLKELPKGFLPRQRLVMTIEYDSNFFAEAPRAFRVTLYDLKAKQQTVMAKFENLQPKFNKQRGCYTLNFFGRVQKASARNFQLVRSVEEGEEPIEDFTLSHGKCSANNFNLDFREPFSPMVSFASSLSAIGKKRVVG
mmetsp:Transcript_616/g.819  ORF Transcript_616/g.819 Transcript_616/m.819 type:complete len:300 (+) Transcript_616:668-1567(+)